MECIHAEHSLVHDGAWGELLQVLCRGSTICKAVTSGFSLEDTVLVAISFLMEAPFWDVTSWYMTSWHCDITTLAAGASNYASAPWDVPRNLFPSFLGATILDHAWSCTIHDGGDQVSWEEVGPMNKGPMTMVSLGTTPLRHCSLNELWPFGLFIWINVMMYKQSLHTWESFIDSCFLCLHLRSSFQSIYLAVTMAPSR